MIQKNFDINLKSHITTQINISHNINKTAKIWV